MTCDLVDDRLLDFIEGELPSDQAEAVRAHFEHCPACAAKYRETRRIVGDLGAARSAEKPLRDAETRSVPTQQPTLHTRPSVIGDFELLGEIGRGGMGVVYRARQITLNRIVALKVLSAGLIQSDRAVARFHREAQAAARLHHTNIVPIYAEGHDADHFYYAMELVDGQPLDKVLRDEPRLLRLPEAEPPASAEQRPPPRADKTTRSAIRSSVSSLARLSGARRDERRVHHYKRIARLVAEVAEALHHAHEQGVVHRDIKPQNLLLGRDDKLHITDFGLARLLDEPGMTLSTELIGTPAYMSPEQIAGGGKAIDRRTDVFALGVTLYELLTLRRPFEGDTYDQMILQILKREPKPPRKVDPHVPVDLETICVRAVEKEPGRRFPTAGEMARDLRRYAEDFPITSRRVGPLGKTVRLIRRHPARAGAIAATALALILAPLMLRYAAQYANKRIDSAFNILMADYRDYQAALAELDGLGWLGRMLGDRDQREMAEAFANIRPDPVATVDIVEKILERNPGDPDAHYLAAWAYRRRTSSEGAAMWARARQHIERADALDAEPSAAGWFFRGQAVWGTDPKEAQRTFDKAIAERQNFVQAMLHQARALNQIMYLLREIEYYEKAVSRLDFVTAAQPSKAYPRYLLAITHQLAAEDYASQAEKADSADAEDLRAKSRRAYEQSLAAARDAQHVERDSPRGYAAEAGCLESQGRFSEALAAWNRIQGSRVKTPFDRRERDAYGMRLWFWLGDCEQAEQKRVGRYGKDEGVSDGDYDPDAALYKALIAATAGDHQTAEHALISAVERARPHAEPLLLLDASYRLIGLKPPADLWTADIVYQERLSPGWTRAWLSALVRYQRGELS